jgi:hypothetical protein
MTIAVIRARSCGSALSAKTARYDAHGHVAAAAVIYDADGHMTPTVI